MLNEAGFFLRPRRGHPRILPQHDCQPALLIRGSLARSQQRPSTEAKMSSLLTVVADLQQLHI
jgi:hypothetical protein